jgi:hypothetical protein
MDVAEPLAKNARKSVRTSPKLRKAIQNSSDSEAAAARRLGVHRKTVAKWRARLAVSDDAVVSRTRRSTVLSLDEEAIVIAYRQSALLSIDDCLPRLQQPIPHLKRSALHRCFKRRGGVRVSRNWLSKPTAAPGPGTPTCFRFSLTEVQLEILRTSVAGLIHVSQVFLAIEEFTKYAICEVVDNADPVAAAGFLARVIAESPKEIFAVATPRSKIFAASLEGMDDEPVLESSHPFSLVCRLHEIQQWPAAPGWLNHL